MAHVFFVLWGCIAVVVGSRFMFRTDALLDIRMARMARTYVRDTPARERAKRARTVVLYRVVGGVFAISGVLFPVLAFTGVIPIE